MKPQRKDNVIRVLHVTSALDGGGVEQVLWNYCSRITSDRVEFDFIVHNDTIGMLEIKFKERGSSIFRVSPRRKGVIKNYRQIKEIIKEGNYDIVHSHLGVSSFIALRAAKKYEVKVRIAHNHSAIFLQDIKERIISKLFSFLTKRFATNLMACGHSAAICSWGERAFELGRVKIVKNAIPLEKFRFSKRKRNFVRESMNLENKLVLGNIARFTHEKNHKYLIDIFDRIIRQCKDAVLLCVGQGELEQDVKKQVRELKLEDHVIFLGARNDVPDLMNAMDLLLLPSHFEGIPLVLLEAQANGLTCFGSTNISNEVALSNKACFLALNDSPQEWADKILNSDYSHNEDIINKIKTEGYDIDNAVNELLDFYNFCVNRQDFLKRRKVSN